MNFVPPTLRDVTADEDEYALALLDIEQHGTAFIDEHGHRIPPEEVPALDVLESIELEEWVPRGR